MPEDTVKIRDMRKGGWFRIDNEIIDVFAPAIGAQGLLVYMVLCRHASRDEECFPSLSKMVAETQISKSSVRRSLVTLEHVGLISVQKSKRDDGGHSANIYTLVNVEDAHLAAILNDRLKPLGGVSEDIRGVSEDIPYVQPDTTLCSVGTQGGVSENIGGCQAEHNLCPVGTSINNTNGAIPIGKDQKKKTKGKKTLVAPAGAGREGDDLPAIVVKTWPPEEPVNNPVLHMVWRFEIALSSRFPENQYGRIGVDVKHWLQAGYSEDEVMAAFAEFQSANPNVSTSMPIFTSNIAGLISRIRRGAPPTRFRPDQGMKERSAIRRERYEREDQEENERRQPINMRDIA